MPPAPRITSRQHPLVKRCRALARRRDGAHVLLDGEHLVDQALSAGVVVDVLLAVAGASSVVVDRASRAGTTVYEVSAAVLDAASPVRQPSGILAIAAWTPMSVANALSRRATDGPCLAPVSVQDPGNLGSLIRAADALGGAGVLALDDTADPGGWKALRGAMGSTFRIPVGRGSSGDAVAEARRLGLVVAATTARARDAVDPSELPANSLVLLGNEGAGLPDDLVARTEVRVSVPMRPGVESLNVAVTAALILDAVRRAGVRETGPT